jgi:DUF3071 family protein
MRNLKLVGLSADGRRVVFVDDAGSEYAAPADERLRAALRGDRARLGQLEIEMDSVLRPRDIQARIRAGETPDAVAILAQVSVDKIMPFCVPVLAERQHISELARRSHVRRKNADGPARRLSEVVAERLRGRGVDPETAAWDAWRRDDGRWSVAVAYRSGEHERSALFTFDAMGRYSTADDDEAKWLTGERQSTSKGPQPRDGSKAEPGKGGDRLLSSVPSGEDLLSLSEDDVESSDDLTAVVRAVSGDETDQQQRVNADEAEASGDDTAAVERLDKLDAELEAKESGDAPDSSDLPATEQSDGGDEPETEPTPERKRRGGKRPSVPSWDEIMFGRSKDS